jgi:hypothetical protein
MRLPFFLAALLLWSLPASAGERIYVPALGFEIEAPEGWQQISGEEAYAHHGRVRLDDAELQRLMGARSQLPVLSLRRIVPRGASIIPTLNVSIRPQAVFAGDDPVQVMERTVRVASRAFADLEVLDAPQPTVIAGLSGARLRFAYTLTMDGRSVASISEFWIVSRGDHYIYMAVGYAADEPASTREAILAAVRSVTIAP